MAGKRGKMSNLDRAKQFAPFDALTGFEEAIEQATKEYMYERRRIRSEEEAAELNARLTGIRKKDVIALTYYDGDEYRMMDTQVLQIDDVERCLVVAEENGRKPIPFDDIYDIEKL